VPTANVAAIKPNHDGFGGRGHDLLRRLSGLPLHQCPQRSTFSDARISIGNRLVASFYTYLQLTPWRSPISLLSPPMG
jgi:hypothetical protein